MYWDDADNFTFGYLFLENNVTSLLSYLHESQPFQDANGFFSRGSA